MGGDVIPVEIWRSEPERVAESCASIMQTMERKPCPYSIRSCIGDSLVARARNRTDVGHHEHAALGPSAGESWQTGQSAAHCVAPAPIAW